MHRQWQCWALEVSARRHLGSVAHGLVFLVAQRGEGVADNTCGGAGPWLSSGGSASCNCVKNMCLVKKSCQNRMMLYHNEPVAHKAGYGAGCG